MYRNPQFAFFSEMNKYEYVLVTDCWLLHMLHSLAIFKLFSTCFRDRHGTSVCFMHHHYEMITLTWFQEREAKNEWNKYICLVHHPQSLPMDVHETLLKLIVAVTDHHYHIIHAQGSIYLIECASITSVSLIMHYFHYLGNHFFVSQAPYPVCTHRGTRFHRNL